MINHLPRGIIKKLRALAIYQVIGGLLGLIITIWAVIQYPSFTPFIIFLFAIAFGLYIFSLLSGWLLWNQYTAGIQCSLINQYLQIVQFTIAGWAYTYISGCYFSLGIDLTYTYKVLVNFGIISTWQLKAFTQTDAVQLSFNFVAILLIVFLTHVKRDLEEDVLLENLLTEEKSTL
jgi:hypothetical protein